MKQVARGHLSQNMCVCKVHAVTRLGVGHACVQPEESADYAKGQFLIMTFEILWWYHKFLWLVPSLLELWVKYIVLKETLQNQFIGTNNFLPYLALPLKSHRRIYSLFIFLILFHQVDRKTRNYLCCIPIQYLPWGLEQRI